MANENKTAKEYVQKGYLIAHLANCGIRTINYDEWERLCECIHEAKPADVVDRNECSKCVLHPFKQLREQLETNMVEVVHGEWIDKGKDYMIRWTCSNCGRRDTHIYDFCPDCGADMRGEPDEKNR